MFSNAVKFVTPAQVKHFYDAIKLRSLRFSRDTVKFKVIGLKGLFIDPVF